MKPIYDVENPEWSDEDFRKARPAPEMLPQLFQGNEEQNASISDVPVSIHLSSDVVAYFQTFGNRWQTHLNEVLQEYVASHASSD